MRSTMKRFSVQAFFFVAFVGCLHVDDVLAFQQATPTLPRRLSPLWGKVKRGNLGKEVDGSVAQRQGSGGGKKTKKGAAAATNISPALAEWMASQQQQGQQGDSDSTTATTTTTSSDADGKTTNKRNKKQPRVKQSARKEMEDFRDKRVDALVKQLEEALESGKPSIDDILGLVRQLLDLPTGNFKQLMASAQRQDFRLAWVGSDDAVSHVGTGLHKVPLARLQEVFLSFCGRNQVEIQEVIRVLGPFPNVKNTLSGQGQFDRQDDAVEWRLTWDSLVDGTGNEILAGKDENVSRVDLQVYFSSPSVVVAVVPPQKDDIAIRRADPLENNGQHMLVFVRENDLSEQLSKLRVG